MKTQPIVRTFFGKHIDLSKVISISDAYFIDRMGSGGYYVGFDIQAQLLDNPIRYEREFEHCESGRDCDHRPYPLRMDGRQVPASHYHNSKTDEDIMAVIRLQEQVDELIEQWKEVIMNGG